MKKQKSNNSPISSNESYKTIAFPTVEVLFKEKNSKFFGYCFPVSSETQVKTALELVKKQHQTAKHFCYAYQIGTEQLQHRANDDGEPNNSAGLPIFGQIQSFGLTEILIVVVRYFGGTKLGVGGLISAYKTTAKLSLETAEIIEKNIKIEYEINFEYSNLSLIMRILKEKKWQIVSQSTNLSCKIIIAIGKNEASLLIEIFEPFFEIQLKKL